jgi:2-polyprenyl-3-methyl-5-hydroxy-6-metoxy-1,4-benzoquinol methylase
MPNLRKRSEAPEKMDDPAVPEGEVRKALRELEIINGLLGGYKVVLHALNSLDWPREPVVIMDFGCGGGDMLRAVSKWADQKQRRVRLIGIDMNPAMTRYAGNKSLKFPAISFRTANVFDDALMADAPHIAMCSLFAHHFDHDDLVKLVRHMYSLARRAVIINDLHRNRIAYHSIKTLTALFSRTHLVKYDGPLSVARSLTRREWQEVMTAAGIGKYTIRWRWAWRWEIIIEK